jgi:hydroxyacylglutathione hydrolase
MVYIYDSVCQYINGILLVTFFKQYLSGCDHAVGNSTAHSMANFSYAIGCPATKECMLVDPSWGPHELNNSISAEGYKLTGIIATHHHFDHIGGNGHGVEVLGALELINTLSIPLYCHKNEQELLLKKSGIPRSSIHTIDTNRSFMIGKVPITIYHTPGHSPGGICIAFDNNLLVGDTLFHEGCGRTDLEGGNITTLLNSLSTTIAPLDDSFNVYCGHNYGKSPSMSLGEIRKNNYIFQQLS